MTEKDKKAYPMEFPSRNGISKPAPIVDVAENEIYPIKYDPSANGLNAGENISEVVVTETEADTAEQTIRGRQR